MSDIDFIGDRQAADCCSGRSNVSDGKNVKLDKFVPWQAIMAEYNRDREEVENYIKKRDEARGKISWDHHPIIAFLNESVFPTLCNGLILMLEKVRDETSCHKQKSAFNGIDFLSEYLFNMNCRYPERRLNWTYIFDMDWVQNHLTAFPRPFYPLSLLWSKEYAARKIQSYVRGYWVRRREDVQEVRNFWKDYKIAKQTEAMA